MVSPRSLESPLPPPGDAWLASIRGIPGVSAWFWSADPDRVESTAAGAAVTLDALAAEVHEDDRSRWWEAFRRARQNGEGWQCSFRAAGEPPGRVEERGRAWPGQAGQPEMALALRLQVAPGEAAEGEGPAGSPPDPDLAAILEHDLGPLISAVVAEAKALRRRSEAASVTRSRIAAIVGGAQRVRALLGDLAESWLLASGGLGLELRSVDLGRLLRGARNHVPVPAGRERISIDLPPGPLRVVADPGRIERALADLLVAALDGPTPGARVAVKAEAVKGRIAIALARVPAVPRPERPRLGVVAARLLVAAHGGTVEAGASAGAPAFRVQLPLRPPRT
jgi:signal transduction histidine kinase